MPGGPPSETRGSQASGRREVQGPVAARSITKLRKACRAVMVLGVGEVDVARWRGKWAREESENQYRKRRRAMGKSPYPCTWDYGLKDIRLLEESDCSRVVDFPTSRRP